MYLFVQLYATLYSREVAVAVFEIRVSKSPAGRDVIGMSDEDMLTLTHMQPFRDLEYHIRWPSSELVYERTYYLYRLGCVNVGIAYFSTHN